MFTVYKLAQPVDKDMPFDCVGKCLFGLTRSNWPLVEVVKVLSLLLDKYIAIQFLFLFPLADTGSIFWGEMHWILCLFFCVLTHSALAQFSLDIFLCCSLFPWRYMKSLVPLKLHSPSMGAAKLKLPLFWFLWARTSGRHHGDRTVTSLSFLVLKCCCFSHRWSQCVSR